MRPDLAQPDEVLAMFREAIEIYRRLADDDPAQHQWHLAVAIFVAALCGPHLGAGQESLALAREGVEIMGRLARERDGLDEESLDHVAIALGGAAGNLVTSEPEQAETLARESVEMLRRLVREQPAKSVHEENLHSTLTIQSGVLMRLGRAEPARAAFQEAVRIRHRLDRLKDPDGCAALQGTAVMVLGLIWLQGTGKDLETGLETALAVLHQEARDAPVTHATAVSQTLYMLDLFLRRLERWDLVLAG
ncbi:hypothetical protein [Nonomuraea sp. NPDC052265]|uniref:hypothetical protein n=1 Tax=Nonomuraea sp. NPDC052265 TaxID=3364374 RepID=UPI0037C7520B